jgi:AcrR family transcriptional regulator
LTTPTISDPARRAAPGGAIHRARARKGEGGRLRAQILEATEALLAERGSQEAVSIRDVADRVGVTPPAIYLHFSDKDQLFYECCRRGWSAFAAELAPVLAAEGSPIGRLRRLGEAYIAFGLAHPEQYRVLFSGAPRELPDDALNDDPGFQILLGLVSLVEEGMAAGEIRPELEAPARAVSLWAITHGAVEILLCRRDMPVLVPVEDEAAVITALLDLAATGIATPKGRRRLA